MRIHVSKDGQQFGPYTIAEIKAYLVVGHFEKTDLGMPEGTDQWQQIGDLVTAASEVPPADSPASEGSSNEEDVDYEKLKKWEGQFEDFEEEGGKPDEPTVQPLPVQSPPPTPAAQPAAPAEPPPAQPENVESAPQQSVPESSEVETQSPETVPATSEPPPPQSEPNEGASDEEPPPPRRKRRRKAEDEEYEDDPHPRKRRGSRRGRNRKISGMNQGRTVIVVKGGGIGSKIFTTLIVLLVVSLIVGVIGFGAFFAAPQAVGPLLQKIGIPVEIPTEPSSEAPVSGQTKTAIFAGLALTNDQIQRLRSSGVDFFKMTDGEGLRCVASVEPGLGLNDEDLPALEPIAPKLVWLDLSKGNLTNLALARLTTMSNLRRLYLEDNKGITSRGVSNLSALGKLQCLNLVGTSLDDSVVKTLSGMSELREVYLWRSGVSPEAVQKLREARPKMLVQAG